MSSQNIHLANRDAPIPIVLTTPDSQSSATPGPETPSKRDASPHRHLSATSLKHKLENLTDSIGKESPSRISDRLMNTYVLYLPFDREYLEILRFSRVKHVTNYINSILSQVLPTEDYEDDRPPVKDRRSRKYVDRPAFSLPVMSSNFRRFNSRIGVAFIFQNRLIRLFSWKQPTQTISFLAVYTFVCLDPALLAVLPLAACLFFVMVPAFLARHPPPPTHLPTDLYPLSGPPLAAAPTVKPAPELSKDFFRNMRDLQNCMEDFSRVHDAVIATVGPLTNFSNEALSSVLYIILLLISCALFIVSHLLPWRCIFLTIGWAATISGHPQVQDFLATPETENLISEKEHEGRSFLLNLSKADIALETSQEAREVEVFELQHRPLFDVGGEYEPYLFSPSPYAPLSPARIAGDRPKGTPFFEDVQPPRGWRWADKKWTLDLMSREWVEERCVTAVEVEVEGERWVTDLHYEELEDNAKGKAKKRSGSKDLEKEVLRRAWEQSKPTRKGEWRRRRWVRGVERVPVIE